MNKKKNKRSYCPGVSELLLSKQVVHFCRVSDINLTPLIYDFMEEQNRKGNLCMDWRIQFYRYVTHRSFLNQAHQGFNSDCLNILMDLKDAND